MKKILIALSLLTAVAACDIERPIITIPEQVPTTFTTLDPNNLEQTVTIQPPPKVEDADPVLGITSIIVNKDKVKGVQLIFRSCRLLPEDVETSFGRMLPYGDEDECPDFQDTLDLAPGQATPLLSGHFLANVSAGIYPITVRHAISPSFVLEAKFRKP